MSQNIFTPEEEKRIRNLLKIKYNQEDEKGLLLKKVLDIDPSSVDDETQLTYEDFNKFLYVPNIEM